MSAIIGIILVVTIGFAIDFGIVALCYGLIAWAFSLTFSWAITLAISVVFFFVCLLLRGGKK